MRILFIPFLFALLLMNNNSFSQEQNKGRALVVGHRGSSKVAPENTVAAAKLAWEQGADAVEVDVHLSSDNKIVVIHDKGTKRTTGKDFKVSETSYDVLKKLDAGSWKEEKYQGEKIPLLSDVVNVLPEGRFLVVEIKSDKKIVPFIQEEFSNHAKVDQLLFIAFNYETICDAKKAFPNNKAFWLSSSFKKDKQEVLKKVKEDGLDGVDLNYRIVNEEVISLAKSLDLEVHTWTVNNLEKAIELNEIGVNSITTDIPDKVLEAIQNK